MPRFHKPSYREPVWTSSQSSAQSGARARRPATPTANSRTSAGTLAPPSSLALVVFATAERLLANPLVLAVMPPTARQTFTLYRLRARYRVMTALGREP